jgi:hypothetical protein
MVLEVNEGPIDTARNPFDRGKPHRTLEDLRWLWPDPYETVLFGGGGMRRLIVRISSLIVQQTQDSSLLIVYQSQDRQI